MMRKCELALLLLWAVELLMALSGSHGGEFLRFNQDDLLLLRNMDYPAPNLDNCGGLIPRQHGLSRYYWRKSPMRKRGRRGGVKQRLKRLTGTQKSPPLPSIILANVRSLCKKLDELQANILCQWAYKEASLVCLTETWLDKTIVDSELSLDGFGPLLRLDRDTVSSMKKHGGGL